MYLCNCHGVTEQTVRDTVEGTADAFIFAAIAQTLINKGSCCKCLPRTKEIINEAIKQKAIRNSSTPTS
jgi:bacterioferritin-associated ferredoxin